MLIEFTVINYRSFRKQERLSLIANSGKELQIENTFNAPYEQNIRLLKSAIIYGANAAGKSNLITAMLFMKRFIMGSARERQGPIDCAPFLLDSYTSSMASEFEMIFISDGVRYQYGFAVTPTRVTKEWLIAYPEKRPQHWFEREYNNKTSQEEWKIGSKLLGGRQIDLWKKSTRPDALFLSTAHQLNSEQLKPIYDWFKKQLIILSHDNNQTYQFYPYDRFFPKIFEKKDEKEKILNFMNTLDLKINDIRVENREEKVAGTDVKFPSITFIHLNEKNEEIAFTLDMESDGTKKLFYEAPRLLKVLQDEKVLIIDEIDNSLHPSLVRSLIKCFKNSVDKQSKAQLICTSHDVSLLDPELLRRDQIWFVEKKQDNSTNLYSLADFSPRKNEAFGKGYLEGRYGALPFIGEWQFNE
jgi:uncharacterized protein